MVVSAENVLLLGSILLFISILASKTSYRFGIPTLILFLIVGMLAGSDGPGGIYFNDPKIAQFLGAVALVFILFSGGLDTKWESIKPIFKNGLSLSTLGVFITAITTGLFASYVLNVSVIEGMLLGAIVSSTDAAAVFSILRSKSVGLKGNLRPLLEFESGSNDPMAFFLTIGFTYLLTQAGASILELIPKFFIGMGLGALCGYAFGKLMVWIVNHIKLDVDGLYPVLILSLVFFTFSFTDAINGNGFLAVYISAIILGNANFIHKKSLMKFYDGQAWLMQIVMFLTLGLLVFPSQIPKVIPQGLLISLFLMFVARPLSVFIALARSRDLNPRKKLFISWVGLRGAVPIVFATYPMLAGVGYANTIFDLVFFISVLSVLLQGTTLGIVARWLHVSVPEKLRRKFPLDIELSDDFKSELIELDINENSPSAGKAVVELQLPKSALIVMIYRHGKYLTASGDTVIQKGDHLLVMADTKETVEKVNESFGIKN
ncbi:MAG TPA: potassium/proton antiporter [Cyclobacteriaceae bacterium]|nr:potassium/proton antiporter [Cyclobacteriaceae bacterium]